MMYDKLLNQARLPSPPTFSPVQFYMFQHIQRKAKSNEKETIQTDGTIQTIAPGIQSEIKSLQRSGGKPLSTEFRRFMEPRFGKDFSAIRVHSDDRTADVVSNLNAVAITRGTDLFIPKNNLSLDTKSGSWLLAHELAHAVQQSPPSAVAQSTIMRLTPEKFKKRLSRTPKQKAVVNALFNNSDFRVLWDWIGTCGAKKQDLGPVKLRVRRVSDNFVEQFGKFNQKRGTLVINAKKKDIKDNPQELVDTIVHELIHAISWAVRKRICPDRVRDLPLSQLDIIRANIKPNTGRELPEDPLSLVNVKDQPARGGRRPEDPELKRFLISGPSASDPCRFFQDLRSEPQQAIIRIVRANMEQTGLGGPTRTFANQILREDISIADPEIDAIVPKFKAGPVVREFMACRDKACFKEGKCTRDMIEKRGGQLCQLRPVRQRNKDFKVCFKNVIEKNIPRKIKRGTMK